MVKLASRSVVVVVALLASGLAPVVAEEAPNAGKTAFLAQKCDMCHSVPGAGIEGKMKSETMKGPDLGPAVSKHDPKLLSSFIRKQGQLNGKDHKKEFTGTDEELSAILSWLTGLKS